MSRLLHGLGRSTAAHPWRTILTWLLVAVGVYALAGSIGGTPQDNWDIPHARAQAGIDQLREHTPGAGNASARVVVHTRDGAALDSGVITPLTQRLGQMPHAVSVSPPRLSADRDTALLTVEYDAPVTDHALY
jgi:RND superfamily putative drug exporter